MRILFVIHQFFPDYTDGTEVLALNTAIKMRDRGCDVGFFTGFPAAEPPEKKDECDHYMFEGMNVWRFNQHYQHSNKQPNIVEQEYNNLSSAAYFKIVLDDFKPDIVHVFHFQRVTASILTVCRDFQIPVVFTPTDFWFLCPTTKLLLNDGSICFGPKHDCANCLKHAMEIRTNSTVKRLVQFVPNFIFSLAMKMSQKSHIDSNTPLALMLALSLRREYLRRHLISIDKIFIPSEIMKIKLSQFLGTKDNFVKLPFYIDFPKKLKRKLCERLRVGFIGTIHRHKGAHVLIKAIENISKEVPLDAFIYGDLNQFPEYSKAIKQSAALDNRIYLKGRFPQERINEIFSTLDVLVIPSLWHENTPLVAYAALTYGCPIVASRIEGMKDLVTDGVNGFFFSPNSDAELSGVVETLAKDPLKLKEITAHATEPIGIKNYIEEIDHIYEKLLQERLV